MGVGWAGLFSLEGAQAGFWAAPAHVGGGRAAPCRPRGPAHFPEPSGQHRPVPFGPLTRGEGSDPSYHVLGAVTSAIPPLLYCSHCPKQ